MEIFTLSAPTEVMPIVYEPTACLVLQGAKRTMIGDTTLSYGAGECLVVATEVPALGQISEASEAEPYLALNLRLKSTRLAALLLDMAEMPESATAAGFGVTRAGAALLDAWRRMVELLDRPDEIPVLAPRLEDELLFRLLIGPQGGLLRQIARADSGISRIRRVIAWIRDHLADDLTIETMAEVSGMSVTTFHRRFKATTGVSPLQYQKQLRLHEARRRLIAGDAATAAVAFSVGYESASQFSREYKRLFGLPPGRDARRIQRVVGT